jgi:ATP-binding cassette subfamily B protein
MKFHAQMDQMSCGPTCLKMVCSHYGLEISISELNEISDLSKIGTSIFELANTGKKLGFNSLSVEIDFNILSSEVNFPCILHWKNNHFVVLYKITKKYCFIADPAHGLVKLTHKEFKSFWLNNTNENISGKVVVFEPTENLYSSKYKKDDHSSVFKFILQYLKGYRKYLIQILIGLITGSLIQLIFPFLTQAIVDIGIKNNNLKIIHLILIAQLFLFIGYTLIEAFRNWILLHISTNVNLNMVSDFIFKLLNLPISFFDSKVSGDIIQRIGDHRKIDNLLTTRSVEILFSFFNLLIFGGIIFWYNKLIFAIFLTGSILYIVWIFLFLKKRKNLDYKKFSRLSQDQVKLIELIHGIQDIKLNNAENQKRIEWTENQVQLNKIEIENLKLMQLQTFGSNFINELKNIIISVVAASLVINGQISLGMMMSIMFIIGQLNVPIHGFVDFIYNFQDAKIAVERLSEIHNKNDEDKIVYDVEKEFNADIIFNNVSFKYPGSNDYIIKNFSFTFSSYKSTAIVGSSGSGKTSLLKLLLKYYDPTEGEIIVGETNLQDISSKSWRSNCGVVMQDGFIFNDTIEKNISMGSNKTNSDQLKKSAILSNIYNFIINLPQGFNTKIGIDGIGMSTGQKQRLLIARAIYKNPSIICFDEATSSLDSNNEKEIMMNLNNFLNQRTSIIIAHRLSTVRNVDQIIVLEKGSVIEKGTHDELIKMKGSYFQLVKNQLEIEA